MKMPTRKGTISGKVQQPNFEYLPKDENSVPIHDIIEGVHVLPPAVKCDTSF